MTPPLLAFRGVWKSYTRAGGGALHALRDVSFAVEPAEVVSIMGRSGSGKSTLLHLAAGIDRPSRGAVSLAGRDLARLADGERTLVRRRHVGLVFQFFHLLPHLTVGENVALPAVIAGDARASYEPRVAELLERVALAERSAETVEKLSGGEQQRVAICRALLRRPALLLADEPTGNLDDETGRLVIDLLLRLSREEGSAVVYVTHSGELADMAERRWRLQSGVLGER